ncbi:hypothetical protein DB88DRAFT_375306 [Papiliotrema laurentii]|uniref:Uncharacterized protein n=1 Tax=Papiliotrema laurentii TaxID=5418 RepID=A0AAD9FNA4_PAPLA|nr:hypothetical protein DB88DRAFT_375306 [Papiliotrema laurentii]
MWEMSTHNLRVNGHNYEDYIQATEMFDEVLDRNLWALEDEKIVWELTVSEHRKQRPRRIVELEKDIQGRRMYAEWYPEGDDEDEQGRKVKKAADIPKPPRHAETIKTFQQVVENISELATNVPQQLSRAQRAANVREEIANLPQ